MLNKSHKIIDRIKEKAIDYPKCSGVGVFSLLFILIGLLNPSWLGRQLENPAVTLLRGITFSILGLWVYKTGNSFFKHFFNHEFQSKEKAQLVIIFFMLTIGMLSGPFTKFYSKFYSQNHIFTVSGILALGTRYLTNASVEDWKLLDTKPVTWMIYLVSLTLIASGHYIVNLIIPPIV